MKLRVAYNQHGEILAATEGGSHGDQIEPKLLTLSPGRRRLRRGAVDLKGASGYPGASTKAERPGMKRSRFISAAMAASALLVCVDPASANGIDVAVYAGRFNNLDQNL